MEAIPKRLRNGKGISYDGFIPKMTMAEIVQSDDDCLGFCLVCGNDQDGCEPDARKYTCESCGEKAVYGIATLTEMDLVEIVKDQETDALYQDTTSAMKAEMHRGFVSMQMFCPCGGVLDCRKSVGVDVVNKQNNKLEWSKVICLTCWEGATGALLREKAEGFVTGLKMEVYNGKTGETMVYPVESNNETEQTSFNLEVGHEEENTV